MTARDREAIREVFATGGWLERRIESLIEKARAEGIQDGMTRGIECVAIPRSAQLLRLIRALLRSRRIDRAVIRAVREAPICLTPWDTAYNRGVRDTRIIYVSAMAEADRTAREETHHA
jgi:uncharacterized protein (DUF2236 family)